MILTGPQIIKEIQSKNIIISPFSKKQVNPNSYNYRIASRIKVFCGFENSKSIFKEEEIPKDGLILSPGKMYLATTKEIIGSNLYAMSLIGRSSIGRYGLFLQVSANLGHTTSNHRWTLELVPTHCIKIFPNMIIGQVSFWKNFGTVNKYLGKYGHINSPQESFFPLTQNVL